MFVYPDLDFSLLKDDDINPISLPGGHYKLEKFKKEKKIPVPAPPQKVLG